MIRLSAQDEEAWQVARRVYALLEEQQTLRTTTSDILVEAGEGMVTLKGRVRTNILRRLAERLARSAVNGWQLENDLISDDELSLALAAKLATDPRTADANVRSQVFLGVAHLGGFVRSQAQREAALALAREVPGITAVQDYLTVRS